MNELEERMFRLSEALLGLEPENSSRLRLALKFSREEQILDQMRETHKLLKDAQLSKAETEVKELIAKLEHLRTCCSPRTSTSSSSWRGSARCARRSASSNGSSRKSVASWAGPDSLWSNAIVSSGSPPRRPDLETLVRDQQAVIDDTRKASKTADEPAKQACAAIRQRQVKLRSAATALANDPLFADLQPPHLRRADTHLGEAVTALEKADVPAAIAAEDQALGLLRQELARLDEQVGADQANDR